MQIPDLVDHSVVGRVEKKGVPSISEMADIFRTLVETFNYLLASNAISIPVCVCMIPAWPVG
jgi:hypothetical protein